MAELSNMLKIQRKPWGAFRILRQNAAALGFFAAARLQLLKQSVVCIMSRGGWPMCEKSCKPGQARKGATVADCFCDTYLAAV